MGLILYFGTVMFLTIILFVGYYIIKYPEKIIKDIKASILRKSYKKIIFKIIIYTILFFMIFLLNKSTVLLNYTLGDTSNKNTIDTIFKIISDKLTDIFTKLTDIIFIFGTTFCIPIIIYYLILFLIRTYIRKRRYRRIKKTIILKGI